MKSNIATVTLFLPFFLLLSGIAFCQITPSITARVDTSQKEVKAVYTLIGNYLNSNPDSLYRNPYWKQEEVAYYYASNNDHFDQAAHYLFFNLNAKRLFSTFKPTILSIEPVGEKYVMRILLASDRVEQWMIDYKMNPPFILRYYAAKDKAGEWKLENVWSNELAKWQSHRSKWITFHYPPSFDFSLQNAKRSNDFIDSVASLLDIRDIKPFDFYVMSSEEELGRLFNMDYWLAYQTGFARKNYNRIFSAAGREDHLHEFVHMLYHPVNNHFLSEGIATFLGGVDGHTPYTLTLKQVSEDLYKNHPQVTFKDLYSNSFHYPINQNPRYVAGAVVYQLVYDKKGLKGIKQLEESENSYESFIKAFASVMNMRETKAEDFLTKHIREFHLRSVKGNGQLERLK